MPPLTPTNWLPLIGEWEFSNAPQMRFNGKPFVAPDSAAENVGDSPRRPPEETPTHGIALSDLTFSGGTVEAEITFNESEKAVGELILAYNSTTREMLTAGIGGWPGMFSVLSTQRRGTVPKSSSAGLFCGSVKPVEVANFIVTPETPHAFVVMQFSAPYTDVYLSVIKSVCAEFGITAIRADEIYGPGVIVQDIVEQVVGAQLVIADISVVNANVYFEVGYALASKKPLVLLAKKDTALPFDVSGFRVLFYEDSIGGKAKVEDGLRKHLTALVGPADTRA
jgi:hypothetical protein